MRRKILGVLVCMLMIATVVPTVLSEDDNRYSISQNITYSINTLPITDICEINGTVVNSTGQPLDNVTIWEIVNTDKYLMRRTDSLGKFLFLAWDDDSYVYSFERYGYLNFEISIHVAAGQKHYDMGIITMEKQTFPMQGFGFAGFCGVDTTYGNATITLIKKVGLFRWNIDVEITKGEMYFKALMDWPNVNARAGPGMNVSLTSFFVFPDWLIEILNHPGLLPMKVEGDVLHSLTGIGWYKITEN